MTPIVCDCGSVLVEDVSAEGVTPLGGEPIQFRRDTDYVVCSNCHKVYKAKALLSGASLEESLVTQEEDAIASLEHLAEENDE